MAEKIEDQLVQEAKDGRANELACGLIAMDITAAALFLNDRINADGSVSKTDQIEGVKAGLLAKAKAVQFGKIAAEKLCAGEPETTRESLANSIAVAVVASVALSLVTRACGGQPVASAGMCAMAAQAILKDIKIGESQ